MALKQAFIQYQAGKTSLSVYLEEGHAGVHGISASRLKDAFGRPVIIFCPKSENPALLTGSARSVDGLHLREALEAVNQRAPDLLASFGGHQGAAGLSLKKEGLETFSRLFEQVVLEKVLPASIGPVILTDGELPGDLLNIDYIETLLGLLNPFGREFEPPQFEGKATVLTIKLMGEKKNHARLGLMMDELWFEAVWFNCCEEGQSPFIQEGEKVSLVYSPKLQTFRRERQLKCQIVHIERDLES
jgi:single-stranded-DNA-specific exonuclease